MTQAHPEDVGIGWHRSAPTTSSWSCSTASTATCSGAYGGDRVRHAGRSTPSPASALRFTGHHAGSLPCMPARHDILVGALDFPWRPWGSIEVWEDAVTRSLRRAGVTTMLVSDHPHLFETGGENYHTDFTAWAYERGHENDPWRTTPDPTWMGSPALPVERPRLPPRLRRLPHLVPRRGGLPRPPDHAGGGRVDPDLGAGPRPVLPHGRRVRPPRAVRHARALRLALQRRRGGGRPGHLAALPDRRRGQRPARPGPGPAPAQQLRVQAHHDRPLVRPPARGRRRGRAGGNHGVVLCHRPRPLPRRARPVRQARRPRLQRARADPPPGAVARAAGPGRSTPSPRRSTSTPPSPTCSARTSGTRPTGTSLLPLIEGTATSVRELALFGYWGRHVGVTDGRHRYLRGCGDENLPLSMWSNRWSTMPVHPLPELRLPRPDEPGRAADHARARRCRSSSSRSAPVTPSPTGPSGHRRTRRSCSTPPSTRARPRTGPASAWRTSSLDGLAGALHAISAARGPPGPAGAGLSVRAPPGRCRAWRQRATWPDPGQLGPARPGGGPDAP